jgi:hypothetical protein
MLERAATAAAVAADKLLVAPLGDVACDNTAERPGEGDLDLNFPALVLRLPE